MTWLFLMKSFGTICFVKFIGLLISYQQFDLEVETAANFMACLLVLFAMYILSVFFYTDYCCEKCDLECCDIPCSFEKCCGGAFFILVFTAVEPLISYQVFREASF